MPKLYAKKESFYTIKLKIESNAVLHLLHYSCLIKSINSRETAKAITYLANVLTKDLIQPGCTSKAFLLLFSGQLQLNNGF